MDMDEVAKKQAEEGSDNIFASGKYVVRNEPEDTVHKARSYDLSITYDFYY